MSDWNSFVSGITYLGNRLILRSHGQAVVNAHIAANGRIHSQDHYDRVQHHIDTGAYRAIMSTSQSAGGLSNQPNERLLSPGGFR